MQLLLIHFWLRKYSSVLEYPKSITQDDKIQNQITRKLSQIQTITYKIT